MKKLTPILLLFTVVILGLYLFQNNQGDQASTPSAPPSPSTAAIPGPQASDSFEFTASQDSISAFDLLQSSAEITFDQFEFGSFVTSINGVKPPENNFWALYVNGEKAQTGASDVMLKTGDVASWKIESIQ